MKHPVFLLLIILIAVCIQVIAQTDGEIIDNEELKTIYKNDQADRQSDNIDWTVVSGRDLLRQARVRELLDSNKVRTSLDYANAAMIFQHGGNVFSSTMAVKMMRKAVELDSTRSKWLLAAAIDRDLMNKGQPQIYGTQYHRTPGGAWEIYDLDTTKVSDTERREFGVRTLAEQKERLRMMNKKKLSELLSNGKSIDHIIELCESKYFKESEYNLSESGINSFGYHLMAAGKDEDALRIFELNTKLYPEGYNAYDSLGECLVKLGRTKAGIEAYEKSLELNANNKNAESVLAKLKEK